MKQLKFTLAIILSMAVLGGGSSVNASDKGEAETYEEYDVDNEIEVHNGYRFIYEEAATIFDSWDDYIKYSPDAREVMKNDTYECYMANYDYIYMPTYLMDETDKISCIYITPSYCRLTFTFDDENLDSYHYFSLDNTEESEYRPTSFSSTIKTAVGDVTYYENGRFGNRMETAGEKGYCCDYDNSVFEFSAHFGLENMGDTPFTKVYVNEHMQEKDGKLYYMTDGKPQSGWQTVNGHKYYFRSKDKTAVCGAVTEIDGIVYKFNENGICKGKYTGNVRKNDGSQVYYKDGVIQE